jgi:hypothetical protein
MPKAVKIAPLMAAFLLQPLPSLIALPTLLPTCVLCSLAWG